MLHSNTTRYVTHVKYYTYDRSFNKDFSTVTTHRDLWRDLVMNPERRNNLNRSVKIYQRQIVCFSSQFSQEHILVVVAGNNPK